MIEEIEHLLSSCHIFMAIWLAVWNYVCLLLIFFKIASFCVCWPTRIHASSNCLIFDVCSA